MESRVRTVTCRNERVIAKATWYHNPPRSGSFASGTMTSTNSTSSVESLVSKTLRKNLEKDTNSLFSIYHTEYLWCPASVKKTGNEKKTDDARRFFGEEKKEIFGKNYKLSNRKRKEKYRVLVCRIRGSSRRGND